MFPFTHDNELARANHLLLLDFFLQKYILNSKTKSAEKSDYLICDAVNKNKFLQLCNVVEMCG